MLHLLDKQASKRFFVPIPVLGRHGTVVDTNGTKLPPLPPGCQALGSFHHLSRPQFLLCKRTGGARRALLLMSFREKQSGAQAG